MATVISTFPEYLASASNFRGPSCHWNDLVSVETHSPTENFDSAHGAPENVAGQLASAFVNHDSCYDFFASGARAPQIASVGPNPSYPNYVPSCDASTYSSATLNQSSMSPSFENGSPSASQYFSNRGVECASCRIVNRVAANSDVQNGAPALCHCHASNPLSCAPPHFGCHNDDAFTDVSNCENQDVFLTHSPSEELIDDAWIISAIDGIVNSTDSAEPFLDQLSTGSYSSDADSLVAASDENPTSSSSIRDPSMSVPSSFPKKTFYDVTKSSESTPIHTRTEETPAEHSS